MYVYVKELKTEEREEIIPLIYALHLPLKVSLTKVCGGGEEKEEENYESEFASVEISRVKTDAQHRVLAPNCTASLHISYEASKAGQLAPRTLYLLVSTALRVLSYLFTYLKRPF